MARRRKNMDDEVTLESQDGADAHEEKQEVDDARLQYDKAIDAIACGVGKLTKAGVQGEFAGKIAHHVWCSQNGQPAAE